MWFVVILASLSFLISFSTSKRLATKSGIFFFILMMLMCGLRHMEVGQDTHNYYDFYIYGAKNRLEFLFVWIITVCNRLGLPVQSYIFVTALLTYIPLIYVIRREVGNPSIAACIYIVFSAFFFANTFNVIRMAIAGSFFLLSTSFLHEKRIKSALTAAIVAFGFHYSVIIPLIASLLLIYIRTGNIKILRSLILITLILGVVLNDWINEINQILNYFNLNDSTVGDFDFTVYTEKIEETENNIVGLLSTTVPYSILCYLLVDKFKNDWYYRILFVGCVLNNCFIQVSLTYRVTAFFYLFILFVLPNALEEYKEKNDKQKWTSLVGLIGFIYIWYLYKLIVQDASPAAIFPYKFYWE